MKSLEQHLHQLKKLSRASNKNIGKAPHKPILLISILQLIRKGEITNQRIFITPELVLAFKSNWNSLVDTPHTCNFAMPFFYMRSEPFWSLVYTHPNGSLIKNISTLNVLRNFVLFAEIDADLFEWMNKMESNLFLENELKRFYFPYTSGNTIPTPDLFYNLEEVIINEIINEPSEVYQTKMQELQMQLTEELIEEERFIRGGIFKREIPKLYNQQCCISGMRIESLSNAQMVDACHIKPFSISNDDTISNGICLSPNLHRAFDRGLITITEDFIVRVTPTLIENSSVYGIQQFEGNQIKLPENPKFYPSPSNFRWHRMEKFVV